MDDRSTYQKIADSLKNLILSGKAQPGDRLPGVRELSEQWNCTPGTVQKSFDQLVRAGLVESKPGKGTFVAGSAQQMIPHLESTRRAGLILKTEQFILECISAGYSLDEVSEGLHLASEHWRILQDLPQQVNKSHIRFAGSSDMVINTLAELLDQFLPGTHLDVSVSGSMEGILALGQGKADVAGCHLWDPETSTYNVPYIQKILPGRDVTIVTLAQRRIGIITAASNPLQIHSIADLSKPGVRFINRQNGSGTRVWFDQRLKELQLEPQQIHGYQDEKKTHTEIARLIAEGEVDAGIGLEAAAKAFGLDFSLLTLERYDLVTLKSTAEKEPVSSWFQWLKTQTARDFIHQYYGYETDLTGEVFQPGE